MKTNVYLLPLLLVVLTLGSCSHRIYLPDRTNAPFLSQKGEVNLTGSMKWQNLYSERPSYSFDGAGAVTDHIGITASFRHTDKFANETSYLGKENQEEDSINYSGYMTEAGAGYFMPFSSRGLFEVYGGFGYGHLEHNNLKKVDAYKTDYARFYIQPAVALLNKDVFEFGGGMRITLQRYLNFESTDPTKRYDFTTGERDISSTTTVMLEPFLQLSVGYKYAKFNVQSGFSLAPTLTNSFQPYVSMGIKLSFAPRYLHSNK